LRLFGDYGTWDQQFSIIRTIDWWKNVNEHSSDPKSTSMNDVRDFLGDKI
jgi:hypothetical protein